jgi:hypothetical protein
MSDQEIWLTPDQAASLSGRSMISIRALAETTYENEGTRHLLQVFKNEVNANEPTFLLHRSLITAEGLLEVQESDVVERLSARIQQLEAEAEILRFRVATVRQDPIVAPSMPIMQETRAQATTPEPVTQPKITSEPKNSGGGILFWTVLGLFILITFVIVMFILLKQGYIQLPQR